MMKLPRYRTKSRAKLILAGNEDGLSPTTRDFLAKMNDLYGRISSDTRLTPVGQKGEMTAKASIALSEVQSRRREIRRKIKEKNGKIEKLVADRRPVAPTEVETAMALRILDRIERLEDRGNQAEATRQWRVFTDTEDPQAFRLQVAFAQLPKAVVGMKGEQYQSLIVMRHGAANLTTEMQALAAECESLVDEDQQLAEASAAVIRDCDRAVLETAKIVEKFPTAWTSEERREFLETHTLDEYQRLLSDEMIERSQVSHVDTLSLLDMDPEAPKEPDIKPEVPAEPVAPQAA